jgi:hypothetical protein
MSSGMPGPLSAILTIAVPFSRAVVTRIRPLSLPESSIACAARA